MKPIFLRTEKKWLVCYVHGCW